MSISARLSRTLHQALGDEAAEDLVNWMQHVDANRSELRELNELYFSRTDSRLGEQRHWIEARFAESQQAIDKRFAEFGQAIDKRFAEFQQAIDKRFAESQRAMETGLARLETKLERRFADLLKWSFVFWVGAVVAIAALAGALRR